MSTIASQITSLTIVYSTVYSDADQRKHQFHVTGLCVGNLSGTGEFPAQMASNAENVSIWWRHHGKTIHPDCPFLFTSPDAWIYPGRHLVSVVLYNIGSGNRLFRLLSPTPSSKPLLTYRRLGNHFNEICIKVQKFYFKRMHLKMSPSKWWPLCYSYNVFFNYFNDALRNLKITLGKASWLNDVCAQCGTYKERCALKIGIKQPPYKKHHCSKTLLKLK